MISSAASPWSSPTRPLSARDSCRTESPGCCHWQRNRRVCGKVTRPPAARRDDPHGFLGSSALEPVLGALFIGNVLPLLIVGCGAPEGDGVDIAASKKASASGGLQFPGPVSPDHPRANPNFTVPDPAAKPREDRRGGASCRGLRTRRRVHPHRAAGGDLDHRGSGRPAAAGSPVGPRGGPLRPVRQQPETTGARGVELRGGQRRAPCERSLGSDRGPMRAAIRSRTVCLHARTHGAAAGL